MATFKLLKNVDQLGLAALDLGSKTSTELNADGNYFGLIEVTPDSGAAFTCIKLGPLYLWVNGDDFMASTAVPDAVITDGTVVNADITP